MQAIIFAVFGIFLYATQQVMFDQKLRPYNPVATALVLYLAMTPLAGLALAALKFSGKPGDVIAWPSGANFWWALAAGAVFFIGDALFISSYSLAKGNVFSVSVCAALLPVFVMIIYLVTKGTLPNGYQLAAIGASIIAVVFAAMGGQTVRH